MGPVNNQIKTINPRYVIPPVYKLVYKTMYKDVYLDSSTKTLLVIWNQNSVLVTNEIYSRDCFKMVDLVNQYHVRNLISDSTMNKFIIPPDLQAWYAKEVAIKLEKAGLKNCAIIMENDLNLISSLEEIADTVTHIKGTLEISTRFFPNLDKAREWLRI